MRNSSKYRGVSLDKRSGEWRSQIVVEGTPRYLGRYSSEIEAALAYDDEAYLLYGSEARLNFSKTYALKNPKKASKESSFEGVTWDRASNKWLAALTVDGYATPLGFFKEEIQAVQAYEEAVMNVSKSKECFNGRKRRL
jgi:AP2-like factor (euAP2 lineage)